MIRVLFFIRMTMSRTIQRICLFLFCLPVFGSCMKWDYGEMEDFSVSASGLFITNEGNFQYSNATLSYYDQLDVLYILITWLLVLLHMV